MIFRGICEVFYKICVDSSSVGDCWKNKLLILFPFNCFCLLVLASELRALDMLSTHSTSEVMGPAIIFHIRMLVFCLKILSCASNVIICHSGWLLLVDILGKLHVPEPKKEREIQ